MEEILKRSMPFGGVINLDQQQSERVGGTFENVALRLLSEAFDLDVLRLKTKDLVPMALTLARKHGFFQSIKS